MYRLLKFFHILGLTLFLGSVFGHIVASVSGGAPGTPQFLFARQEISAAIWTLTVPGLALSIATGLGLVAVGRLNPIQTKWLALHSTLAVIIAAIAAILIIPAAAEVLRLAGAMQEGSPGAGVEQIMAAKRTEDIAGAINVLLALIGAAVGVWKPKF